jgi:hypothetical protein
MTSIPRDPAWSEASRACGYSVEDQLGYEAAGERGSGAVAVKRLLSIGRGARSRSTTSSRSTSGGFRGRRLHRLRLPDIDRDYFNDQGGPGGYAVIDIDPGYQKLCGKDALAYVRYRHGDNDLVRSARQQDFLRQVRSAKGTRKLMADGIALGNLKRLARVFARYFDRDKSLDSKQEVFKFAKTVLFTADNPVREVRFRVAEAPDGVNLIASESMLKATVSEFMNAKGSATPREQTQPTRAEIAASKQAGQEEEEQAVLDPGARGGARGRREPGDRRRAQDRLPVLLPTLRTSTAAYQGTEPRTYKIKDERGKKHDAYRLVLAKGVVGEYYGIQGMTWRYPPILDDPHETIVRNGRELLVYRDGKRIRLVAWRTRKACTGSPTRSPSRSARSRCSASPRR